MLTSKRTLLYLRLVWLCLHGIQFPTDPMKDNFLSSVWYSLWLFRQGILGEQPNNLAFVFLPLGPIHHVINPPTCVYFCQTPRCFFDFLSVYYKKDHGQLLPKQTGQIQMSVYHITQQKIGDTSSPTDILVSTSCGFLCCSVSFPGARDLSWASPGFSLGAIPSPPFPASLTEHL